MSNGKDKPTCCCLSSCFMPSRTTFVFLCYVFRKVLQPITITTNNFIPNWLTSESAVGCLKSLEYGRQLVTPNTTKIFKSHITGPLWGEFPRTDGFTHTGHVMQKAIPLAPFTTLIPAWISDHMPSKVCDEITYPFLNFNGCTIEV